MVRVTANGTADQLQNNTVWSSYAEIIDVRQRYPSTRRNWLGGIQAVRQPAGDEITIFGRIIQVPSNYDR